MKWMKSACSYFLARLFSNITLRDGLGSYISFSIILITFVTVAEKSGRLSITPPINDGDPTIISVLVSIAVVIWTASVTFILFSIERLEVVNIGIRFRNILRVAVSEDLFLLYSALGLLIVEIMLVIMAAWNILYFTCLIVTILKAFNFINIVFVILRYNSRDRALKCVLTDSFDRIKKINNGHLCKKNTKNDTYQTLLSNWHGVFFYAPFHIIIWIGDIIYLIISSVFKIITLLFIRIDTATFSAHTRDNHNDSGLIETEWLIYQMCRNMDYSNQEDCIELINILKEIDKYCFEGKRKLFVRCISTIIEESENVHHTGDILKELYAEAREEDDGDLELRKALIESILLYGESEHIQLLNGLENESWGEKRETEENEILYWKYICSIVGRKKIVLGAPPCQYLYEKPVIVGKHEIAELIYQLAYDEGVMTAEFLQAVNV